MGGGDGRGEVVGVALWGSRAWWRLRCACGMTLRCSWWAGRLPGRACGLGDGGTGGLHGGLLWQRGGGTAGAGVLERVSGGPRLSRVWHAVGGRAMWPAAADGGAADAPDGRLHVSTVTLTRLLRPPCFFFFCVPHVCPLNPLVCGNDVGMLLLTCGLSFPLRPLRCCIFVSLYSQGRCAHQDGALR